jgi:hypothetical protein
MADRLNLFDSFSGPTIKRSSVTKGPTCSFCVQFSFQITILAVNVETRFRLRLGQKSITTEFISFGTVRRAIIGSNAPRFTAKNLNKSPPKAESTGAFQGGSLAGRPSSFRKPTAGWFQQRAPHLPIGTLMPARYRARLCHRAFGG